MPLTPSLSPFPFRASQWCEAQCPTLSLSDFASFGFLFGSMGTLSQFAVIMFGCLWVGGCGVSDGCCGAHGRVWLCGARDWVWWACGVRLRAELWGGPNAGDLRVRRGMVVREAAAPQSKATSLSPSFCTPQLKRMHKEKEKRERWEMRLNSHSLHAADCSIPRFLFVCSTLFFLGRQAHAALHWHLFCVVSWL